MSSDLTKLSVNELIQISDSLQAEKGTIANTLQELTDYILPTKSNVTSQTSPGVRRGHERFSSTAVEANQLLAASMQGTITSSAFQWFKMKLSDTTLMEIEAIRDWLDDCTNRMYDAFNASNFQTEVAECYLDLGGYGTTAMSLLEKTRDPFGKFQGLLFKNWPIAEYTFIENDEGIANTIFRRYRLRAYEAAQFFNGKDLGRSLTDALSSDKADKRFEQFEFIHCIYPRFGIDPRRSDRRNMPYGSKYIGVKDKHLIDEGGFHELPAFISRWSKASDDRGWGRGPGDIALSDIKSHNTARKLMFKAWSKDVDPPIKVTDKGVIGQIRTYPSGVTYLRKGSELDYLQSQAKWDASQYNEERLISSIRSIFFADQLVPPTKPDMTLGEFLKRVEIIQRVLGPVLTRHQGEFLSPTVFRGFNIMLRAGAFLPMPDELKRSREAPTLDIEYVGPLSRAQKLGDVEAIQRGYALVGDAVGLTGDQSLWDNFDHDEAVQIGGRLLGMPEKVIRGKDQVAAQRQRRAAAEQMQARLATAEQASVVAKNVAQAQAVR